MLHVVKASRGGVFVCVFAFCDWTVNVCGLGGRGGWWVGTKEANAFVWSFTVARLRAFRMPVKIVERRQIELKWYIDLVLAGLLALAISLDG